MNEHLREDGSAYGSEAGYKQTEVGVIPEDWDAQPLGISSDHSPASAFD